MSAHIQRALDKVRAAWAEVGAATDELPEPVDTAGARLGRLLWPGAQPEEVARRRLGVVAEHLAKAEEILESMR